MIFLVQLGINKYLYDYKLFLVFEKFTSAHLIQIALKII